MSLLRPIAATQHGGQGDISQPFDGDFAWEAPGYLRKGTYPAGSRKPFTGALYRPHLHLAIDYIAAIGTHLYATHAGKVVAQFTDTDGAVVLYLRVLQTAHFDLYCAYWHLKAGSFRQKVGTHVARGRWLAQSGATGQVTGPHLHMELWQAPHGTPLDDLWRMARRFDPQPFIDGKPLTAIV